MSQALWQPAIGPEADRLLQRSGLDDRAQTRISCQAVEVLSRCADPAKPGVDRTGLAVGYVQSGKTLSFTTVVALARDNSFPLVILLAGTKDNLHTQTGERLAADLGVERQGGMTPWNLLRNPGAGSAELQNVASSIQGMRDPATPEIFRRATVITVMKNPTRLRHVREFVEKLPSYGVDLSSVPILVVDDEADQAGLNGAVANNDVTATYQAIMDLRDALPHHSYVMYTATPQAPLLVNLADSLSPDFVTVLDAGDAYTGGEYFFVRRRAGFVKRLTDTAVAAALSPSLTVPPDELQTSLATFFLALAQLRSDPRHTSPVSMLVHPSQSTNLQGNYERFVQRLRKSWQELLATPGPDRDELVADWFKPAYDDLVKGGAAMRPLEELLRHMQFWVGATQVRLVNAATAAEAGISWDAHPAWILIGGNKLDRGFTVEGLVVTYMPRRLGAGQVDSVQQRARFFGYKRSYGELCRAWLAGGTADAFEHYVEHEQLLRKELRAVSRDGRNLKEWTRLMLLDPRYKPTRKAVIDLQYMHGRLPGDTWASVSRLGRLGVAGTKNLALVETLVGGHESGLQLDNRDPRTDRHNARVAVPVEELVREVLSNWKGHADDRALVHQAALLLSARLDDDPDLIADLYLMDELKERERSVRADETSVVNLQQGRNPTGGYPGDKAFSTDGLVSVQVHKIKVKPSGEVAVGLSIRIPAALAGGVLVQYEEGDA